MPHDVLGQHSSIIYINSFILVSSVYIVHVVSFLLSDNIFCTIPVLM